MSLSRILSYYPFDPTDPKMETAKQNKKLIHYLLVRENKAMKQKKKNRERKKLAKNILGIALG